MQMKRLTFPIVDCYAVRSDNEYFTGEIVDRLASLENIIGEEYDLAELAELVEAKREGQIREDIHGEWIQPDEPVVCAIKCSVCGETEYLDEPEQYKDWNFCPNCGARMTGGAGQ